jgi:hypothetical protein
MRIFEASAHRGFTLETGKVTGFLTRKPDGGRRPMTDAFSGIHLVSVKKTPLVFKGTNRLKFCV